MPGMHLNLVEHRTSNEGRWAKPGVQAIIRTSISLTTRDSTAKLSSQRPRRYLIVNVPELLAAPEGKTLEFKRDLSSLTPILNTLVAFSIGLLTIRST